MMYYVSLDGDLIYYSYPTPSLVKSHTPFFCIKKGLDKRLKGASSDCSTQCGRVGDVRNWAGFDPTHKPWPMDRPQGLSNK